MYRNEKRLLQVLTLAFFFFVTDSCVAQHQELKRIKWKKENVAAGLTWKRAHVPTLFGARQNINILAVDTKIRQITLVYDPEKNRLTSEMASNSGAIAAINAGFFDMKNGGSSTYIKVDGYVPDDDTTKWRTTRIRDGALIIMKDGTLDLEKAQSSRDYSKNDSFDDVLVTGSLLIDNGVRVNLPDDPFVTKRHPRTCLGLLENHKVVLVTVDGRAEEAAGMTLHELTDLMISLKCREAINLDGGGSTTMWLRDNGGVVNMPSDNRKFDHEGERPVSNVIVIK